MRTALLPPSGICDPSDPLARALLPLRVRGLQRVRLHADLTMLATLSCALARALAVLSPPDGCNTRPVRAGPDRSFDPNSPGARKLLRTAKSAERVEIVVVRRFFSAEDGASHEVGERLKRPGHQAQALADAGFARFVSRFAGPS